MEIIVYFANCRW